MLMNEKFKKKNDYGSVSEVFFTDYRNDLERKCSKINTNNSHKDKGDVISEVLHKTVKKYIDDNVCETFGKGVSDEAIYRHALDRGVWTYIRDCEEKMSDKAHYTVEGKNLIAVVHNWDSRIKNPTNYNQSGTYPSDEHSYTYSETVADLYFKSHLDNLIYQEYVELFLEEVENEKNNKYINERGTKRSELSNVDSRRIAHLLIEGERQTDICRIMGINAPLVNKIKRNVLQPALLMVIDDELWYRKHWNDLGERAKKIIREKKGIDF